MPEGIAFQNKDIEFKILSEGFKEKSFHVYGLDLPRIKEVLPTNLPRVSADEKRIDNLFLLEDGTIAIVDYEAEDKLSNRVKYVNYIARVMEKYYKDKKEIINLHLIVIYTGDIEKAHSGLETECFSLRMEQVFLSHMQGESIYQAIKQKIGEKKELTEEELMQLIILPLTDKGRKKKQERIKQVVELAKEIKEEKQQLFVLTGILVNTNQFIDRDYAEQVRRWLSMNKVFQIFEEEKQEAVNEARLEKDREFAERLIAMDLETVKIMKATGLTKKQIEEITENNKTVERNTEKSNVCSGLEESSNRLDNLLQLLKKQQEISSPSENKVIGEEIDSLYVHIDNCETCIAQMEEGGAYYEQFYGTQTISSGDGYTYDAGTLTITNNNGGTSWH